METEQAKLFPDIGVSDETPDVDPVVEDNDGEDQVDPVQDQLKEMQAKLDKQAEENSRLNTQLLQTLSRPAEQSAPQAEQDEKLPDLLEDPEGYAATLERNIEKKMERKSQVTKAQTDQAARYTNLTNRFQLKEPELAKENWDVVEFIVTKKVKEAQSNGVSVDAMIFSNQDQFIADVARDVKAMVGGKPDDEDTSSTTGLPSAGGISKRGKSVRKEKAPKSMAESMREIRRLTPGFHNPASVAK